MTPFYEDCLFFESMRFDGCIGVSEKERSQPQPIVVDLYMGLDLTSAALTDQLKQTVDYDCLSRLIKNRIEQSKHHLLEALGQSLCDDCFHTFHATWVHVRLHKPNITQAPAIMGIQLFRKNPALD